MSRIAKNQTLKTGTRVYVGTRDAALNLRREPARIVRWQKVMGPRESMPGWYPIKFDADGATLMCHEDGLQVAK